MIRIASSIFLLSLLFASCGQPEGSAEQAPTVSNDTIFVLNGLSKDIELRLEKDGTENSIQYGFNENFGQIELTSGDLGMLIYEEDVPMNQVREELAADQLFTYQFETESESLLVYQSVLPDGTPHSWQFVQRMEEAGMALHIRTNQSEVYNRQQIEQLMELASRLKVKE